MSRDPSQEKSALPWWPASRLGEAVEAVARRSGLAEKSGNTANPPDGMERHGAAMLGRWIEAVAACLGVEAELSEIPYADATPRLRTAGPALVWLPERGFLALIDERHVAGPDFVVCRTSLDEIRREVGRDAEAEFLPEIESVLDQARIPPRRRKRARAALLENRLRSKRIAWCWQLRASPGAPMRRLAGWARLPKRLAALAGVHFIEYSLWILSWWLVGRGALEGRLDQGWLMAWALLLLTLVPLRVATTWLQGRIAISAGGLLKERLLFGALRLEPDEIKHQGAGQLLGRVLEAEAMEALALSGGFLALVAGIELVLAAVVLGAGAGGPWQVTPLVAWVALALVLGARYVVASRVWADERLWMTHDLVERMVGHRTRLAQETRERWHDGEDQSLERYLEVSARMDRTAARLLALLPRGWLVVGILGLAPAFVTGAGSPAGLAVGIGGMLLAWRAFKQLANGFWHLAGAAIAWRQVRPLLQAAGRADTPGTVAAATVNPRSTLLEAHDLVFRFRDRSEPVLRGCSLRIDEGDRVLLEGASGGGKSTLASLLAGLRRPESGLLLVDGLDRQTLGTTRWRQLVAAAPQFHENHVLTGTFAFNLLMGLPRDPNPDDFAEAERVCRELGLGDLLERMPAGLLQTVGETGWQLSHGERSRLYIARALLQGAPLVLLDESFAALDPENLRRAMQCVLNRAAALLVIAHP